MIQYNHLICTASASYIWENIYLYDREFRVHMAKFPERSWGQILQQAWTLFLKDRVKFGGDTHCFGGSSKFKKEIYKRFNKGKCTAGMSCHYDHKCLECGKFGHGAHICRRKSSNGQNQGDAAQQSSSSNNTPVATLAK